MMGHTPSMTMSPVPSGAGYKYFRGTIKSYFKEKGYGFIDCQQAHMSYGRDVFLYKKEIPDEDKIAQGVEVAFNVKLVKQKDGSMHPQAIDFEIVKGKGKGGKGK